MASTTSLSSISSGSSDSHSVPRRPASQFVPAALLVVSITILGAILRQYAIETKSFWLDEGMSVEFARLPLPQFLHLMWSSEANMMLYYALLRLWLILGQSEEFIRDLSVLFSVATIPVVYLLGARLFGRRVGVLAALLLAVNAYHIRYAQQARGYAMVVFFAVLATWVFARNLQKPSSGHWRIYAAVCTLATYSHVFGALVVPAHAISLLSWRHDEIPWRKYAGGLVAFGIMITPIAAFILKTGGTPISWIPPLQPDSLLVLGVDFSGVYGRLLLSLDVLAVGLAALGASRASRSEGQSSGPWGYTLLFSWLIAPIVIVLAVSLVKPIFYPRFLNPCLPAFVLLVAVGVSWLRPVALSWGLLVAIVMGSIAGDLRYYQEDFEMRRQDWRSATAYVFNHAQPGDRILFYPAAGEAPFNYYSSRQKPALLRPKTLQIGDRQDPLSLASQDKDAALGTDLWATSPDNSRVWLVLMFLNGNAQEAGTEEVIRRWLSSGRRQVDSQQFTALSVKLFDRSVGDLQAEPATR